MPANTYTLIEKIVVGAAGASSITFTSIPQTYTDLCIVASARASNTNVTYNQHYLTFNSSTTSFSGRRLWGNSAGAASFTTTRNAGLFSSDSSTSNTFGSTQIYIPNYTGSTNKSFSVETTQENNSATDFYVEMIAGLWSDTSAITSITLTPEIAGSSYKQYSTFYLYGIAKEGVSPSPSSAPYATGGDSIVFDGTYWIHTFRSSGTFTPLKGLSCDVLVVAGGGGGGGQPDSGNASGGGGAGGFQTFASQSLSATAYTVTVGAGGSGGSAGANNGSQGSNSVFGSLTASVGGGFGQRGFGSAVGGTGGSGGGSSGSATSGQGNAGGAPGSNFQGGGGGGAGAAGSSNGNGGAGTANSYSGTSVTYAGGGGGGQYFYTDGSRQGGSGGGGNGGGWNGSSIVAPIAGTANLGGGGGGAGSRDGQGAQAGAAGGSGIVIVRYAA